MGNTHLKLVTPAIEKRTVMPRRAKNSELRTREYLTEAEIEALSAATRQNRHGHRDATMILIAFRHGLRASEAVDLRWDQVDFDRAVLHIRRSKGGTPACIHSAAWRCELCAGCNEKAERVPSFLSAREARRSRRLVLPE